MKLRSNRCHLAIASLLFTGATAFAQPASPPPPPPAAASAPR
jgi:hypothetical protein